MTKVELLKHLERMPDETRIFIVIGEKGDEHSVNFGGHYDYAELASVDIIETYRTGGFIQSLALRGCGTTRFLVKKTDKE